MIERCRACRPSVMKHPCMSHCTTPGHTNTHAITFTATRSRLYPTEYRLTQYRLALARGRSQSLAVKHKNLAPHCKIASPSQPANDALDRLTAPGTCPSRPIWHVSTWLSASPGVERQAPNRRLQFSLFGVTTRGAHGPETLQVSCATTSCAIAALKHGCSSTVPSAQPLVPSCSHCPPPPPPPPPPQPQQPQQRWPSPAGPARPVPARW